MARNVNRSSSTTNPALTIRFMGLCALVQDHREVADCRSVRVVMPAAGEMGLGLCAHRPFLSFRHDDLAGIGGEPEHFSYADSAGASHGLWDLSGLELRIEPAGEGAALAVAPEFTRLLAFDELTPGLGAFQGRYLRPAHWRHRVAGVFHLGAGSLTSELIAGQGEVRYGVGPRGSSTPRIVCFRQVALYTLAREPSLGVISIVGRRAAGGGECALRFHAGSSLTMTHLCAVGEDDGDRLYEVDVLAYYELSALRVEPSQRAVLHPAGGGGGPLRRPTMDACPPARAYLSA